MAERRGPAENIDGFEFAYDNAKVTYHEITGYRWVNRMCKQLARKHPKRTKQMFDFNMNLFNYV